MTNSYAIMMFMYTYTMSWLLCLRYTTTAGWQLRLPSRAAVSLLHGTWSRWPQCPCLWVKPMCLSTSLVCLPSDITPTQPLC